ncbi:MAG TPA: vWA domain-containing protein [Chryseolinea sp.]
MQTRCSNFSLWRKRYLLAALAFLGSHLMLMAQINIDFSQPCPNLPAVGFPDQVAGTAITAIPAIQAPGAVSMEITNISISPGGTFCSSPCPSPVTLNGGPILTNITFTVSAAAPFSVTLGTTAGTIDPGAAGLTVTFVLTANNGTINCSRTYSFKIVRKPVDLVLVLDKSGSMGWNSGSSSVTRWKALTDGVGLFMNTLEPMALGNDKIGLTFFDSGPVQPPSGFPAAPPFLIPMDGSIAAVTGNFSGAVSPGGSTAFGAGLQNALSKMPFDPNRNRFIIAFTDGEQNVPSTTFVNVTDGHVFMDVTRFSTDPIRIYPIGIGAAGSLPAILTAMAQSSDGGGPTATQISTEDGTTATGNYGAKFIDVLESILKKGSPQIVNTYQKRLDTPNGTAGFQSVDTFTVNKDIRKLIFNVISDSRALTISSVKKGGIEFLPNHGRMRRGDGYVSYFLDLDSKGVPAATSEGNWIIKTNGFTPAPYEITALVDDHITKYDFGYGNQRQKVGMPFDFTASLRHGIKTIKNAKIDVFVFKPGDDLGDLLARTSTQGNTNSPSDPANPGALKYQDLLSDSTFLKKMLASKQLITLTYRAADSLYTGQFSGTDVSGVYHIIFRATSPDDPTLGKIVRYQRSSTYVYFPDIALNLSSAMFALNTLTFRPIASNGKFIGPGWGNAFTLTAPTAHIQNVVDQGDGTYVITIAGSVNETGVISLGGETFYNGVISEIVTGPHPPFWTLWWFWLIILIIIIIAYIIWKRKHP